MTPWMEPVERWASDAAGRSTSDANTAASAVRMVNADMGVPFLMGERTFHDAQASGALPSRT
jgi:hypothetical protein